MILLGLWGALIGVPDRSEYLIYLIDVALGAKHGDLDLVGLIEWLEPD